MSGPVLRQPHPPALPDATRKVALVAVLGLHALAGAALLSMQMHVPAQEEPTLINIQWAPTAPETPQEVKTPTPAREKSPKPQQQTPIEQPAPKPLPPTVAPVIQTEAAVTAPIEAAKPVAPVQAAAPAAPAPAAHTAPPQAVEQTVDAKIDCVRRPDPVYPRSAQDAGNQGTTLLRLQVDEQGNPLQVEILTSSGFKQLDNAARNTVAHSWRCPMRAGARKLSNEWFRLPIVWTL